MALPVRATPIQLLSRMIELPLLPVRARVAVTEELCQRRGRYLTLIVKRRSLSQAAQDLSQCGRVDRYHSTPDINGRAGSGEGRSKEFLILGEGSGGEGLSTQSDI